MNNKFKLDRTVFKAMTAKEADDQQRNSSKKTIEDRLEIAYYLNSIAYNFDINNPPRMDKTIFSAEKLP